MSARPRLLDLFCGVGGASDGYVRAGFDVVGVDLRPQPNYPYRFVLADALDFDLGGFDVIHASPPCQHYSDLAHRNGNADDHPDLIPAVQAKLRASGRPYIIENVEGAPLDDPITLCGVSFPGRYVIRHRLFESNVELVAPEHRPHPLVYTRDKRKRHYGLLDEAVSFVSVNGGGNCSVGRARQALGIYRGTKAELNEAIPPDYAEHVGRQVIRSA